ncbi:hypothetical protein [Peribacillus frigoritolerans]|uniref:hypothetical protein n=1 Tax=Peribacillus frigoritolerans TaxID=450367 RepID=UPI0020418564|nr:hypothetical protein [Peribacillus frigoritolerans]MCM3170129.1 hypothetical protein [Peribacillus frigoritolerans]
MAINVCEKYGSVHRMYSKGFAVTRDYKTKEVIKRLGGWYKCACGERFICEGNPHYDPAWKILDYVTEGGIKSVQVISGQAAFMIDRNLIRHTDSTKLSGYVFYSA